MKSLWVIFIVVILLFTGWLVKDSIISHTLFRNFGIDMSGSAIVMTPSHLQMEQFRVKNPPSYKIRTAFSSKKVSVDYTLDELMQNPTYIDQIIFTDALITIECNNPSCTDNNWKDLSFIKTEIEKKYVIDRIVFQNLTVEIMNTSVNQAPVKLKTIPYLVLTQIKGEKGFPVIPIMQQTFKAAQLQRYSQGFSGQLRREERRNQRRGYFMQESR